MRFLAVIGGLALAAAYAGLVFFVMDVGARGAADEGMGWRGGLWPIALVVLILANYALGVVMERNNQRNKDRRS